MNEAPPPPYRSIIGPVWIRRRTRKGPSAGTQAGAKQADSTDSDKSVADRTWLAGGPSDGGDRPAGKITLRDRLIASFALLLMLSGVGVVGTTYVVASVETPGQAALPESTTVYYSDGRTVMARLGSENRTNLEFDQMNDAVKDAAVAAEDKTFWTNDGVDLSAVMRAAWHNFTGGDGRQGGSTIAQQYARYLLDSQEVSYRRKAREAIVAWKLTRNYSKEEILESYLNTVPFGRSAYGIEAAAQAYFGKTANRNARPERQITVSEAAMLVANIKQPEPDPKNPIESAGYDPKRTKSKQQNANALANSTERWGYVLDALVEMGKLKPHDRANLVYPLSTLKDYSPVVAGLDMPTGLVVEHALSEVANSRAFSGRSWDYIRNHGFQIITTVDKAAQDAAIRAADKFVDSSPMYVQSRKYQAALVAIEPGTGRVLAYFGGHNGAGVDYAGWYRDEAGDPKGRGSHPPGSSFKVYTLAAALRDGISLNSWWDSSSPHEFPPRRVGATAIRNASTCTSEYGVPDGPCTLLGSTISSLNVSFYAVTQALGSTKVIEMARDAGIRSMWTDDRNRIDFTENSDITGQGRQYFDTEVGFGQYPVTVLDHANGLATFAANGLPAQAHFVKKVLQGQDVVYGERLPTDDQPRVLTEPQIRDLTYALSLTTAANLSNGWDSAGKTGTWQYARSSSENAHGWMVGFTKKLAAAVWVGNEKDEGPVRLRDGSKLFGANLPARIWRQFMTEATRKMDLTNDRSARFGPPAWTGDDRRGNIEPDGKPRRDDGNQDHHRGRWRWRWQAADAFTDLMAPVPATPVSLTFDARLVADNGRRERRSSKVLSQASRA